MRLVPLAGRVEHAVRVALLSHGWEGDLSFTTSAGLESLAFEIRDVPGATLQDLVTTTARLGIDLITGPDWVILSGTRARLSALARPWVVSPSLTEIAVSLGHALPGEEPLLWQTVAGPVDLTEPVIMGILNATPDSFSDGATFAEPGAAAERAETLFESGARIIDVGGESTRPGARPVAEAEELTRIVPVVEAIVRRVPQAVVSIDTTKAPVARAALDAGAGIVNDVSGLRLDPDMGALCAERKAGLVLMHSRGEPGTLASEGHAAYPDGVLIAVQTELAGALERARRSGVSLERVVVDPGLGFGKTVEQSVELMAGLRVLRTLGRPILIGPSRKRFLGTLTGRVVEQRDIATAATCALGWQAGARLFRVHEPGPARDALAVARAMGG